MNESNTYCVGDGLHWRSTLRNIISVCDVHKPNLWYVHMKMKIYKKYQAISTGITAVFRETQFAYHTQEQHDLVWTASRGLSMVTTPYCPFFDHNSLRADLCDMNLYLFQIVSLRMEVTPTVEICYLRWQWKTRTHLSNKILTADNLKTSMSQRWSGYAWWRQQLETISALLTLCVGNSPVIGEFLLQRPVTGSFDVSFDLRLNKRCSKHSWRRLFETPSRSLGRPCHCFGPSLLENIWPRVRAQLHESIFLGWLQFHVQNIKMKPTLGNILM